MDLGVFFFSKFILCNEWAMTSNLVKCKGNLERVYGTMGTIMTGSPLEGIYIQSHAHF